MKNLGRATWPLILSLGILSACGDGGGDTPGGFDIGKDDQGGNDATNGQIPGELVVELGSGSGDSFEPGIISASNTELSLGGSAELSLSIVDMMADNKLLVGQETEVTFSSACISSGDATIESPVTTTSGTITVTYTATGCTGSDIVNATVAESETIASVTLNNPVVELGTGSGDNFQSGVITASTADLSADGTTALSVNIVDSAKGNELIVGSEAEVAFSSFCISNGEATIDSPVTSNSGQVTAVYKATGCIGQDNVTATSTIGEATASVTLDIASPALGDIQSLTPIPSSIALQGAATDSRPSSSVVNFVVVDSQNNGIEGLDVSFRLSSGSEGSGANLTTDIATTNSQGQAGTTVQAGNQNAVVRVVASVTQNGTTLGTTSPPITISTSVPAQAGFSISTDNFMPNAFNHDGETININIRAGDRFGNFANIEGTVINFVSSGGAVQSDCVLDDQGACSVTWVSQDPRPADGRLKILARTVGDESFLNNNTSPAFELGTDTFPAPGGEKGEAFLDRNVNEIFDGGDQPFDFDGNAQLDGPDGIYDGSACLDPDANNCTAGPVQVWDDIEILMASDEGLAIDSFLNVFFPAQTGDLTTEYCATASAAYSSGTRGPLPVGTTFDFSADGGEVLNQTTSFTVANKLNTGNSETECVNAIADDDPTTSSSLKVLITPPAPFGGTPLEASIPLGELSPATLVNTGGDTFCASVSNGVVFSAGQAAPVPQGTSVQFTGTDVTVTDAPTPDPSCSVSGGDSASCSIDEDTSTANTDDQACVDVVGNADGDPATESSVNAVITLPSEFGGAPVTATETF